MSPDFSLILSAYIEARFIPIPIREAVVATDGDDADSSLNLVSGNPRNAEDIFRIGTEHRFGGRLQ
jgi:hypothetical protein